MTKGHGMYLQYSNPSAACVVPVIADGNLDLKAVLSREFVTFLSGVTVAELPMTASVQTLGLWEH